MKWVVIVGLLALWSCQTSQEKKEPIAVVPINKDSIQQQDSLEEENAVQQEKYKKYWGYRFHIRGDFDGDGKQETLSEKLISGRTGQEMAKYCGFADDTIADCWWTWRINWFRRPNAFLQCSNPKIKAFTIDSAE